MSIKTIIKNFLGVSTPEGIVLQNTASGFNVALRTTEVAGEYVVSVRASGNNPAYPEEKAAREVHLYKSETQFNTGLSIASARIPADHEYARIEVALTPPHQFESRPDDGAARKTLYTGPMNQRADELCVLLHVRNERGVEKLWGVLGISNVLPPRAPQLQPAP